MKVLIITTAPPPIPGIDVHGVYKRLGMFLHAFAGISSSLRVLYLPLSPPYASHTVDGTRVQRTSLSEWDVEGVGTIVPAHPSRIGFVDSLSLIFSIRRRPKFKPFSRMGQREAVRQEMDHKPDLIFLHRLTSTMAIKDLIGSSVPIFFDLDDIEHRVKVRTALRSSSLLKALLGSAQVPALYWAERAAVRSFSCSFVCSEEDRAYLARVKFSGNVAVVANAVAFPLDDLLRDDCKTVLFLGGYSYKPNANAAERLITQIWPIILRSVPDAKLLIAGTSPELIPAFAQPQTNVQFLGFVDDLGAMYQSVSLICSPIDIGGGTRVKLIEAAAFAKPIVSTKIGAEGLAFLDGVEIQIRESDQSIAEACISLLKNVDSARSMGAAARKKAHEFYELGAIEERIQGIAKNIFAAESADCGESRSHL